MAALLILAFARVTSHLSSVDSDGVGTGKKALREVNHTRACVFAHQTGQRRLVSLELLWVRKLFKQSLTLVEGAQTELFNLHDLGQVL